MFISRGVINLSIFLGEPPLLRNSRISSGSELPEQSPEPQKLKLGSSFEFSFGHSALSAGVTVTMVETSKVGVKVGMVGRGVIVDVGV